MPVAGVHDVPPLLLTNTPPAAPTAPTRSGFPGSTTSARTSAGPTPVADQFEPEFVVTNTPASVPA